MVGSKILKTHFFFSAMIFLSENRLHEAGYFYAISQSSKFTVGFVQIPEKAQISTAIEQLGSFVPDMILLYANQEYTELLMQQVIIKDCIFLQQISSLYSCPCYPFKGFPPVLAVLGSFQGYFPLRITCEIFRLCLRRRYQVS